MITPEPGGFLYRRFTAWHLSHPYQDQPYHALRFVRALAEMVDEETWNAALEQVKAPGLPNQRSVSPW